MKDRARANENARRYREAHPERVAASARRYEQSEQAKTTRAKYSAEWRKRNPDYHKAHSRKWRRGTGRYYNLRWRYGITVAEFDRMLTEQAGRCAVCGDPLKTPVVDHDHRCCPGTRSCGKCVRGLLCGGCNHAAGHLRDEPMRARALAAYLEEAR